MQGIRNSPRARSYMPTGRRALKFTASWCSPCQIIAPYLDELSDLHQFEVVSVDVDAEAEVASLHGVVSLPTIRLERPGANAVVVVGANREKLRRACEDFFGAPQDQFIAPTDASARIFL